MALVNGINALLTGLFGNANVPIQPKPTAILNTTTHKYCSLPSDAEQYDTADGTQVQINQTILDQAIAAFDHNGAVSIKVFRYNCLVGSSPDTATSDAIMKNIFSATKSVISILTGIAQDQGKLHLDDAIGEYLPAGPGWGDAVHRNVTIRKLLTETSGAATGVVSEGITVLLDVSLPQEALAERIVDPPGTKFSYSQRTPDLLAYVVAQAVGVDLQDFAQQYLFSPIGIGKSEYTWFKDRSGNSYGYAYLFLNSENFARIGLMMQNGGMWNGVQVLSTSYVNAVSVPSPRNGCYGLLFWTNQGNTCYSPTGYLFDRSWYPNTPRDLFAMSGSPQQKNFMIPSLNMTISWNGVLTDSGPPADTWYNFFTILMSGITDLPHFVAGNYSEEPASLSEVLEAADVGVLLTGLIQSPECNILVCNGEIPLGGLIGDLGGILSMLV